MAAVGEIVEITGTTSPSWGAQERRAAPSSRSSPPRTSSPCASGPPGARPRRRACVWYGRSWMPSASKPSMLLAKAFGTAMPDDSASLSNALIVNDDNGGSRERAVLGQRRSQGCRLARRVDAVKHNLGRRMRGQTEERPARPDGDVDAAGLLAAPLTRREAACAR